MSYILNNRERQALNRMMLLDNANFHIKAELGTGIGAKTIDGLLALGLIEVGTSARHYGKIGWRLSDDGWRCMYGKTLREMTGSGPHHYLRVWSWPPTLDRQK